MIIRVYTGSGTSRNGSPLLIEELSKHLDADVSGIDENEMHRSKNWLRDTSLLIFAGQSVGAFKKALGEDVMQDIRLHVQEGAFDYIGICAGAAFASDRIKYRMKPVDPYKKLVIENTGLSMFNGLATGPCRSVSSLPFSGGPENLSLINLRSMTDHKLYNSLYWGGPALIPTAPMAKSDGRFLSLLHSDGTPMSLTLKYGKGCVTMSSFHPEIHAGNVGRWAEARYIPTAEALRIERLARQLDGTAFPRFLSDAGLEKQLKTKRAPDFSAALSCTL